MATQTEQELLKRIGNNIQQLRRSKGLTQEQLAEQLGIDFSYIGFIEQGARRPSLKLLVKIANHLDVPIEDLFQRK